MVTRHATAELLGISELSYIRSCLQNALLRRAQDEVVAEKNLL